VMGYGCPSYDGVYFVIERDIRRSIAGVYFVIERDIRRSRNTTFSSSIVRLLISRNCKKFD
jgi:hypothetical protein